MPQLVRPGFVGKIAGLASAVAGGAAAITYILRATFSGADASPLANLADVETESAGSVEDGSLTIRETNPNGIPEVNGNRLRLTRGASPTNDYDPLAYGPSVTRAAGLVMEFDLVNTSTTSPAGYFGFHTTTAVGSSSNMECGVSSWTSGAVGAKLGASTEFAMSSPTQVSNVTDTFACVLGGWSSGVPSASGTEGGSVFWNNGGTWTLLAADPKGTTATLYPWFGCESSASNYAVVDNILLPDSGTTVESVFQPDGYALDKFTDVNGTNITAHTPDVSVGGYTVHNGAWDIQSNEANCTSAPGFWSRCHYDTGLADGFFIGKMKSSAYWSGTCIRMVDANNGWLYLNEISPNTNRLFELTGGSQTQRASVASTKGATGVFQTLSARCSGTTIECWLEGSEKLSYASATAHQAGTGFGPYVRNVGDRGDDFLALPLTSATYADLDL